MCSENDTQEYFNVFIISLKAAFSLSILARLRSMLQFDFSRIFSERSLTMICWIIFFGRNFVSSFFLSFCLSRNRIARKFGDSRKTKRLLRANRLYLLRFSILLDNRKRSSDFHKRCVIRKSIQTYFFLLPTSWRDFHPRIDISTHSRDTSIHVINRQ